MKKVSEIFREVKDSWLIDVRFLTDDQLLYDRNYWIKEFGKFDKKDKYYRKEDERAASIHTIAILIEQIRRIDEIYYNKGNS